MSLRVRPTAKQAAKVLQDVWSKAMHGYDFNPADLDLVDAGPGQGEMTEADIPLG